MKYLTAPICPLATLVDMSGLTPIELGAVVSSKPFGDRLVESSLFTGDNDLESGFAVYKGPDGQIAYSDVLHPDDEYLDTMEDVETRAAEMSPEERVEYILDMLRGSDDPDGRLPELELGRLITDANVNLRTDLAVVTHQHPLTHLGRRSPSLFNYPSVTDLRHYSEHLQGNPGLIEGVGATHQRLGGISLRLFRAEDLGVAQKLQTLENGTLINEGLMGRLGLRTVVLTFDRRDGRILKGMDKIPDLYPST